jgi:hypothetical protein
MHDHVITEVYKRMRQVQGVTVDDILVTPELRVQFLDQVCRVVGNLPERGLLHRLVYLRKRKRLPAGR